MALGSVLAQATSGLTAITRQLSTLAQNVGNASTPGYVRESVPLSSASGGGDGAGVLSGVATRVAVDTALQTSLNDAGAQVAGGQVRQDALTAIDAVSGTPGSGQDLAGLLGALRDAFSTLGTDPSNGAQQSAVVTQASALANGINALGQAVTAQRQGAQDGLVDDVTQANTALNAVGQLSLQIIAAAQRGQSTAGLEDQRDQAEQTATTLTGAQFLPQPNGDVLAVSGSTVLPLHDGTGPLSIAPAALLPDTPPGAVPALLVRGAPAAGLGGQIGARLALRDTELPALQSSLDGFAQGLATGFATQGLTLFTDSTGVIPPGGTAGFAQSIQVSPAVQATPSIVRDGTAAPGAAGNTTLIDTVLGTVLTSGPGSLASQATDLLTKNGLTLQAVSNKLATDQAVQTSLKSKLDTGAGVSIDSELSEMVSLQNSYGANARVVAAVQAMWSQLLTSVQ